MRTTSRKALRELSDNRQRIRGMTKLRRVRCATIAGRQSEAADERRREADGTLVEGARRIHIESAERRASH
jgi:hypothetical protein